MVRYANRNIMENIISGLHIFDGLSLRCYFYASPCMMYFYEIRSCLIYGHRVSWGLSFFALCRSLGVTMWELFELGNQPYRHYSDRQVLTYAVKEQQLKLPKPQLQFPLDDRWWDIFELSSSQRSVLYMQIHADRYVHHWYHVKIHFRSY